MKKSRLENIRAKLKYYLGQIKELEKILCHEEDPKEKEYIKREILRLQKKFSKTKQDVEKYIKDMELSVSFLEKSVYEIHFGIKELISFMDKFSKDEKVSSGFTLKLAAQIKLN
jgi:hypothetical protein